MGGDETDTSVYVAANFTLPYDDDAPAGPRQLSSREPVTSAVAAEFLVPKGRVVKRPLTATFAAIMPEAAMDEDRNPFSYPCEIRPPFLLFAMKPISLHACLR